MDGWKQRTILSILAAAATFALAAPVTAHDSDSRELDDRPPAGEITSFDADTGTLVIDLAKGGSISGQVTRRTWIMSAEDDCDRSRRKYGSWCRQHLHGGDDGHGWGHHWRHGHGDADDLIPGSTVEDALLVLEDGRALFWKIELAD